MITTVKQFTVHVLQCDQKIRKNHPKFWKSSPNSCQNQKNPPKFLNKFSLYKHLKTANLVTKNVKISQEKSSPKCLHFWVTLQLGFQKKPFFQKIAQSGHTVCFVSEDEVFEDKSKMTNDENLKRPRFDPQIRF